MSTNNIFRESPNKYLRKKLRHQFFLHADIIQNKAKLIYFACRLHTHVFVAQKLNLFNAALKLVHSSA